MTIDYELFRQLKQKLKLSDDDAKELTDAISNSTKQHIETGYQSTIKKDLELLEARLDGKIKLHTYGAGLAQVIVIVGCIIAVLSFILTHVNLKP